MSDQHTIKDALERLLNVNTNSGRLLTQNEEERIQGALQALQFVLGQQSYLMAWIDRYEGTIRAHHAKKSDSCGCGVCRPVGKKAE
jgi:hypothetical protein